MSFGKVTIFNLSKGSGFISPPDGGALVYVDKENIADLQILKRGDVVRYETEFDQQRGQNVARFVTGGSGGPFDDDGPRYLDNGPQTSKGAPHPYAGYGKGGQSCLFD